VPRARFFELELDITAPCWFPQGVFWVSAPRGTLVDLIATGFVVSGSVLVHVLADKAHYSN
jgi:hypothetical protein